VSGCQDCGAVVILRELLSDEGVSIDDLKEMYDEWREEFGS
jgi:hypothetical protein